MLSYDPSEKLLDFLDSLTMRERRELIAEMTPDLPIRRVTPQEFRELARCNKNFSADEFSHRDLLSETEGTLAQVDKLSQLNRQLAEDSDFRVDFSSDTGRPVKIIRKRNPEFSDGVFTEEPEPEEEVKEEALLEEEVVADEVGEEEVQFVSLDEHDYFTPHDRWDLLFDATAAIQRAYAVQKTQEFQDLSRQEQAFRVGQIFENLTYSADFFPYRRWKGKARPAVKQLLDRINKGEVSRSQLAMLCQEQKRTKKQLIKPHKAVRELEKLQNQLLAARQELFVERDEETRKLLKQEIKETQEEIRNWKRPKIIYTTVSFSLSEKKLLWDTWFEYTTKTEGSVVLPKSRQKRRASTKRTEQPRQEVPQPSVESH